MVILEDFVQISKMACMLVVEQYLAPSMGI